MQLLFMGIVTKLSADCEQSKDNGVKINSNGAACRKAYSSGIIYAK